MDHDYEESQISYVEKEGDELFIDLVKSYSHLYDKKDVNYKDIIMKNNSWAEIASIMNWTVDDCQNRWLRLREKFGRELKKMQYTQSGMESVVVQKWPLYDQMKFLEKCISSRKRISNVLHREDTTTVVDNPVNVSEDSTDEQAAGSISSKSCYTPQRKNRKQDAIDISFIELSSAIKNHLSSASNNTSKNDADELFCKFIAAELKNKTDECKRKLKKEITALILSED